MSSSLEEDNKPFLVAARHSKHVTYPTKTTHAKDDSFADYSAQKKKKIHWNLSPQEGIVEEESHPDDAPSPFNLVLSKSRFQKNNQERYAKAQKTISLQPFKSTFPLLSNQQAGGQAVNNPVAEAEQGSSYRPLPVANWISTQPDTKLSRRSKSVQVVSKKKFKLVNKRSSKKPRKSQMPIKPKKSQTILEALQGLAAQKGANIQRNLKLAVKKKYSDEAVYSRTGEPYAREDEAARRNSSTNFHQPTVDSSRFQLRPKKMTHVKEQGFRSRAKLERALQSMSGKSGRSVSFASTENPSNYFQIQSLTAKKTKEEHHEESRCFFGWIPLSTAINIIFAIFLIVSIMNVVRLLAQGWSSWSYGALLSVILSMFCVQLFTKGIKNKTIFRHRQGLRIGCSLMLADQALWCVLCMWRGRSITTFLPTQALILGLLTWFSLICYHWEVELQQKKKSLAKKVGSPTLRFYRTSDSQRDSQ